MKPFKLVFLDGEGHPQTYYTVVCDDDAAAMRQAKATGYWNEIEIWCDERLMRRVNCRGLPPEIAVRRHPSLLA